jgi:uncharacterized Ntn-hydrolase superfamily protein
MKKMKNLSQTSDMLCLEKDLDIRSRILPETMGIEFHTFTVVARCEVTGMLGIAMATYAPCVGSRCPFIQPGLGAVSVQAVAQPRIGALAIKLLELGYSAPAVLKALKDSDPYFEHRQIAVIDSDGHIAAMTGKENHSWAGHLEGKNYVVMGNVLSGERVISEMAEAFEADTDKSFEERLLRTIEAGRDAGGQPEGQRSAHLMTYDRQPFPHVDLRVDLHEEPVGELRRVFDWFKPLIPYYNMRAVDPTSFPRYMDWLSQQGISR